MSNLHPKAPAGAPGGTGGQFVAKDGKREASGQLDVAKPRQLTLDYDGDPGDPGIADTEEWKVSRTWADGTTVDAESKITISPAEDITVDGTTYRKGVEMDDEAYQSWVQEYKSADYALDMYLDEASRNPTDSARAAVRRAQNRLNELGGLKFSTITKTSVRGTDTEYTRINASDTLDDAQHVQNCDAKRLEDPRSSVSDVVPSHHERTCGWCSQPKSLCAQDDHYFDGPWK